MKTYEEMARCVIERRDQYEIEKKLKTRRLTRIAATAACAALPVPNKEITVPSIKASDTPRFIFIKSTSNNNLYKNVT